jgi:hypothetical protein
MTYTDYICRSPVYPAKVQAVKDNKVKVFTIEAINGVDFRKALVEAGFDFIKFI